MTHDEFRRQQLEEAKAAALRAAAFLDYQDADLRRLRALREDEEAALWRARRAAAHARMLANARKRGAPAWIPEDWFYALHCVVWARRDIPGTRIMRGDAIREDWHMGRLSGCHVIRCTVDELEVLRATELDDYVRHVELILDPPKRYGHPLPALLDRRRWGRRRDGTYRTPYFIVRPVRPEIIGAPISASSDDSAIFELLSDVGCRMPNAKDSTRNAEEG